MNASDRRALRRKADDRLQRMAHNRVDPTYTPEWDRLDQSVHRMPGGGLAGWVMYRTSPKWKLCRITGKLTKSYPYTIPKHMPSGTWAPKLDKKIP